MGLLSDVVPFYNMKYTFLVDKIRKVIYSCTSKEQLDVADKYCMLLITKWIRHLNSNDDGSRAMENYQHKVDIIIWMKVIYEKQKIILPVLRKRWKV